MHTILGNVKWGEKALQFLNKAMKMIQPDKPAIIYLRHSKADYSKFEKPSDGTLTEQGEKAALEFGELLPENHRYRIYHSVYPRARITAEKINEGLTERNIPSTINGTRPYLIFSESNEKKITEYLNRDGPHAFLYNWLSGRYPPEYVEPTLDLAKRSASDVTRNLRESSPGTIDLYLTHDIIIAPMMFHWFGICLPKEWNGPLDGFILQSYDNAMRYLDKKGEHETPYPYWWNND
jgi:broad specificity phosphatase PhoE